MNEHTAGPWATSGLDRYVVVGRATVVRLEGGTVPVPPGVARIYYRGDEETAANLRLIVAAPTLLALARQLDGQWPAALQAEARTLLAQIDGAKW